MSALRVGLIDSDAQSRAAIRRVLAGVTAVSVVGEWDNAVEAASKAAPLRPDLLVTEVSADGGRGEAWSAATVERLALRLPDTAILATTDNGSAEFALQLLRAGAIECLKRPVDARELIAALDKLTRVRGRTVERQDGRVTAVFSCKGGLGATTLAVNLAVSLAERASSKNALLVELDTRHSDVITFLDLQPRYSVLDVFESMERMDESLLHRLVTKHASGVSVLPGPARMERAHLAADHVHAGLALLRGHFDHVVLDLRHDFDPATIAALEVADTVLFLTSLNVSALRSATASLAAFRHLGVDTKRLRVVVMRDGTGEDVTVKHAREALALPIYWKMPNEYAPVVASINSGRPVVTTAPRSKFAKSVRELTEALSGEAAPVPARRRSISLLASAWPIRARSGA